MDIKKAITRIPTVLLLTSVTQVALADGFYTIIGPDGFPMVVPQGIHDKPRAKKSQIVKSAEQTEAVQPKTVEQQPAVVQQQVVSEKKEEKLQDKSHKKNQLEQTVQTKPEKSNGQKQHQSVVTQSSKQQIVVEKQVIATSKNQDDQSNTTVSDKKEHNLSQAQKVDTQTNRTNVDTPPVESKKTVADVKSSENETSTDTQSTDQHFSEVDGVKYVNNEFLEDKEFNLEGRKRFYITPDSNVSGTGHVETIERQRGVTKAVIQKFMHPEGDDDKPVVIALSSSYYRLPKEQVVQSLAQSCFSGKKFKKPKELSQKNTQLGLWPVPPLKERFVYEIVKLNPDIEDIKFTSYATSSNKPTFYWPLAVFLDQNGCVVEGVSGFKNNETEESATEHASLEGVLKRPTQARYLFLTPLSEAVEVDNKQLSNQGQIKLSVLR